MGLCRLRLSEMQLVAANHHLRHFHVSTTKNQDCLQKIGVGRNKSFTVE